MTERRTTNVLAVATLAAAAALLVVTLQTPPEKVMGDRIRILYVHVGAAWTAYLAYAVTALGALLYLWSRRARWDRLALASAELGVVLTTLTLVTGSLWGKATQGWWWVWEPRLTITLLMWFLYAAYLILRQYTEGERRAVLSAVMAVAGVLTMVLNHFAVTLWRVMHPGPVIVRSGGPALDGAIYGWGIMLSLVFYTALYATLLLTRMQLEGRRVRLAELRHTGVPGIASKVH